MMNNERLDALCRVLYPVSMQEIVEPDDGDPPDGPPEHYWVAWLPDFGVAALSGVGNSPNGAMQALEDNKRGVFEHILTYSPEFVWPEASLDPFFGGQDPPPFELFLRGLKSVGLVTEYTLDNRRADVVFRKPMTWVQAMHMAPEGEGFSKVAEVLGDAIKDRIERKDRPLFLKVLGIDPDKEG